ncbi:hypothetical protein GCM10027046_23700 [Uliginosibacterium flavum]|uniref:Uncharacterized protein n=1 Tax=Uliginosibacterium flavum TaxID=1396831 RepID=A0ABV2TK54_9RHOO
MTTHSCPPLRRTLLRRAALIAFIALLAACGGGSDKPLAALYTSISITDLSYPSDEYTNDDIKIEARASSMGEISGGDIDWSLDQTSGHDIGSVTKTLSDDNHKVTFHVTAPDQTGPVWFKIKVKANGYSDSRTFSVDIR